MSDNENPDTSPHPIPYEEDPVTLRYYAAREMMDAGQLEQAIAAFHASGLEAPHSKTYELLGECYLKLSRFSEAIPFLAAATCLNRTARAPSLLAEAFLALKMYDKSLDAAKLALSIEPNNRKARHVISIAQPIWEEQTRHLPGLDED